jgi:hypothetical protein
VKTGIQTCPCESRELIPCPESSNVILNLFQDQGLRFQGLLFRDSESILKQVQHRVQNERGRDKFFFLIKF